MTKMDPAISVDNLTVGYHGEPLIRDICLRVEAGKVMTLIGPNGAGKSTILRSMTRQLKTLGGVVYLQGKAERSLSDSEFSREVALVLTERNRTEYMSCRDVVAMGRYPYTGALGILSDADWQKVDEALDRVGAADISDRDFAEISDGQRQRILLARALCQETPVLVLDEPTSFLDPYYQRSLLRLIWQEARERQRAVILSLHELDLARQISDMVVCVKGDRIWKMGAPAEIFQADIMEKLYDLPAGSFDPETGMLDLGLQTSENNAEQSKNSLHPE